MVQPWAGVSPTLDSVLLQGRAKSGCLCRRTGNTSINSPGVTRWPTCPELERFYVTMGGSHEIRTLSCPGSSDGGGNPFSLSRARKNKPLS